MKYLVTIVLLFVVLSVCGKPANAEPQVFTNLESDTLVIDSLHPHYTSACLFARPFHDDSTPHFTLFLGGMYVGGGPGMTGHGITFEAGMLNVLGLAYYTSHHNQRLSMGLGFGMRGLHTRSGQYLMRQDDRSAILMTDNDKRDKTKINIPSLLMPLLYRQRVHGRLNAYGGVVPRLNLGCKANDNWSIKNVRRVNVDLTAGIDCIWLGAYVKYTPISDIKGIKEFRHVLTFGATLAF